MKRCKAFILLGLVALMLTSCTYVSEQHEYYNDKDKVDFDKKDFILKFKPLQFENVLDKNTITFWSFDGAFFLLAGGMSGSSKKTEKLENFYFGYVENIRGGIYPAKIPANKVRIYQDAPDGPYLVAAHPRFGGTTRLNPDYENYWSDYTMFNLHVKPGTIIPKADIDIATEFGVALQK